MNHRSISRYVFEWFNTLLFIGVILVCILPVWHVVCASFSDASWVLGQTGLIWRIKGFTLKGYSLVFQNKDIVTGYLNTFFYVFTATALGMLVTVMAAYALSRKEALWGNTIMFFITFTMMFNGGMIAYYIIVTKGLHMFDSRWVLILPVCLSAYNMIIVRTAMVGIPESLIESAKLDGAGHFKILFSIVLPLMKATLATVVLYYIVAHWNSWFQASIFLRDRGKFPLQLVLKEILVNGDVSTTITGGSNANASDYAGDLILYKQTVKYCTIVVSTLPIFIFYPFIQKHFEAGVMIGAIKG
ncbi:carbohydrate ABC transporter permease [Butyrivibrio sp. MC2013]|uniref:carbohydrate ABC transporter permease n=1 Tax=Butyrivibrio sp. MC2013 TaxID=1280686 RepID=UPI0003FA0BBC|nr:carbohydrate ABC transporter permease [Butyrivibrio sp. MC2013]